MTKRNPNVSVIIATYNRAHLVDRAIKSALDQTCPDFELIIVDDASTDNTPDVVKTFKDKRIRYIRRPTNGGNSSTVNVGIKASSGKYIAFLDDDDEWMPQKLELQLSVFENGSENLGVVGCGALWIDDRDGSIFAPYVPRELRGNVYEEVLEHGGTYKVTLMIKRNCISDVGLLDERFSALDDLELAIRLSKKYYFDYIAEPLVKVHAHDIQITRRAEAKLRDLLMIMEKHQSEFATRPRASAHYHSAIGHFSYLSGDPKSGRQHLLKAVKLSPRCLQYWLQLFLSLGGTRIYKGITYLRAILRDRISRYTVKFRGSANDGAGIKQL